MRGLGIRGECFGDRIQQFKWHPSQCDVSPDGRTRNGVGSYISQASFKAQTADPQPQTPSPKPSEPENPNPGKAPKTA